MVHRALVSTVLALAVAALLVPAAAADKPGKEPLPGGEFTGQFCKDFEVTILVTQNNEVAHIFSSGVVLITGVFKVDVTNLSTDKTLSLNVSGPGKFSADGTTAEVGGTWLLFGEAGQLPGPDPGILQATGRTVFTLGPNGITSIETSGTTEDICAALAA